MKIFLTTLISLILFFSCNRTAKKDESNSVIAINNSVKSESIITGANQTEKFLTLLMDKKVGVVGNQTSVIFRDKENNSYTHLVDSLLSLNINITKVFAPEHGFRGAADAGEHIIDELDKKTGLPIISLYGSNMKPSKEQMKDIDVMLFDIQDVGVRFYTYISTLHYIMEICAELEIPLIVLDRPNPNGHYIDGPILEKELKSFVGMHPVPIVYGLTIGEYGNMINGEKWLENGIQCNLTLIPLKNYSYQSQYDLPIKPSPNLPNATSINLYPSLCFFEGTNISCGRGTEKQFQIFGAPSLPESTFNFQFTPQPNDGAKNPMHNGKICYGRDLSSSKYLAEININWLIESYQLSTDKNTFFNNFFPKLAGTKKLQKQIEEGISVEEIKKSWQDGLDSYHKTRSKYLLYN